MDGVKRIGVREARQNLSVYLRRVAEEGATYEVTDRGRPVARLTPLPGKQTVLDRLIAEGRAIPARGLLRDLPPPLPARPGKSLTEILLEMREEERY